MRLWFTRKRRQIERIKIALVAVVILAAAGAVFSLAAEAKQDARDRARADGVRALTRALERFRDAYGRYPVCRQGSCRDSAGSERGAAAIEGSECYNTVLKAELSSGPAPILPEMPADPLNPLNVPEFAGGSDRYLFRYLSDKSGNNYILSIDLEGEGGRRRIFIES